MKTKFKLLTCVALATLASASLQAGDNSKPNVIVIMADDLGYNDLGFQGSKHIKTPNLDKMAANGIRFSDGHTTASVCSPSRAGFITGRYQQRFGHESNCPPGGKGLAVNELTMGQAMQQLGYHTTIIGKWHLGNSIERHPNKRGFNDFWGLQEGSRSFFKEAKDNTLCKSAIQDNGKIAEWDGYLTDCFGDKAVEYVEKHHDEPFFMFLSFTAPHTPLHAKEEDLKTLQTTDKYSAMIYNMDLNIGRLMAKLEEHKLMEKTIIWFLSDNGGICGAASNLPLLGKKGNVLEGGMRVPFIVQWKGTLPAGKEYNKMISAMDIMPTCMKAAGGKLPTDKPLDGVDLMPYMLGKDSEMPHETLVWRRMNAGAVRNHDWKLIRISKASDSRDFTYALYNLKDDLSEQKNLAAEMPEKVESLKKMFADWEQDMMKPLWYEGSKYDARRYGYQMDRFTGKDLRFHGKGKQSSGTSKKRTSAR